MAQERILIVEDEPLVAQTLCRALSLPEGGGNYVESCDSGEAALERVRAAHFDLIITDLHMPGMSGLELLEQVRRLSATTRSILITAFGSPDVEQHAYQLAAAAYLTKPFSMQQFVETVRHALSIDPATPRRLVAFSESGLRAIQQRIESLRVDVSALGALLLDPSGQLLTETGQRGDFDTTAFLALLGNAMAAANEVAHMLKDEKAFDLHFHEGRNYEIYAARINDQVLLALILSRHGSNSRVGIVWLYLRRAIADLRELLNKAMVVSGTPVGEDLRAAVADALDQALDFGEQGPGPEEPAAPPGGAADATPEGGTLLSFDQARALGLVNPENFHSPKSPEGESATDDTGVQKGRKGLDDTAWSR